MPETLTSDRDSRLECLVEPLKAAVAEGLGGGGGAETAALGVIEKATPSPAELGRLAARLREEKVFDLLPVRVQARIDPDPICQVHRLEGDRMHTVTTVRLSGVDAGTVVRSTIEQPWTWWKRGRISNWSRTPSGGAIFTLWPVWLRSPARVGLELSPATETTESGWGSTRRRWVIPVRLFNDFEGPASYEVVEARGGSVFRSVWNGVRRRGSIRLLPVGSVLSIHLGAEKGTLGFPFGAGTGFPGMMERLGARDAH